MQRFALMLTNLVVTFMVFVELFAESTKWFCVGFTLKFINNVENGQVKDCKGQGGTQRAALCGCTYRNLWFVIIWETRSQKCYASHAIFLNLS